MAARAHCGFAGTLELAARGALASVRSTCWPTGGAFKATVHSVPLLGEGRLRLRREAVREALRSIDARPH